MKKAIFLIIIVISFYSCNNKDTGIPNYPIDADLKVAFNYQPGTYWIYRDSISGRVDSFAVRSNVFSPGNSNNSIGGNYTADEIIMVITEYNTNISTDTSNWNIILLTNCEELVWEHLPQFKEVYNIDYDPLLNYPLKIGDVSIIGGTIDDHGTITNVFTSYILNGEIYNVVAEINYCCPR